MRLIYFILSIGLFILINSVSIANDKIAFIDLNYILSNSDSGKKILDQFQVDNKKNLEFFKLQEQKLNKEKDNIKKLQNILSVEEYNNKKEKFKQTVDLYNQKKSKMIKLFEDNKNKELNTFFLDLNKIMNIFMKENSINLILDKKNIIMANNKSDISEEILQLVNKK
ncbi:OmpH family outer membrane protein [Candidatus Pelagibacter sp.]|nr:OmpH family outer membrane protein [Candidatus Pelagibacter sp.]